MKLTRNVSIFVYSAWGQAQRQSSGLLKNVKEGMDKTEFIIEYEKYAPKLQTNL
jgi:hypothetical protein